MIDWTKVRPVPRPRPYRRAWLYAAFGLGVLLVDFVGNGTPLVEVAIGFVVAVALLEALRP